MQTKTWLLCGVGALITGAAIAQGTQDSAEPKKVNAPNEKSAPPVVQKAVQNDTVRELTPEESARARQLEKNSPLAQLQPSSAGKSGWVRVLPGGKVPASNGFTRSDKQWMEVKGKFGSKLMVLGRGHQMRSVATMKNNRLTIQCVPPNAKTHPEAARQHALTCPKTHASVKVSPAR